MLPFATFTVADKEIMKFRDTGCTWVVACADPEGGGQGSGPPLKNHKNIGFLSNTGPDPLRILKATKPAFNVGP